MVDTPPAALARRGVLKHGIAALAGLGLGEMIQLRPGEAVAASIIRTQGPDAGRGSRRIDYSRAQRIPSACLNCSTICGIIGTVVDGKLVKVSGNPADPNNGSVLCAKGQAGPLIAGYPERLLYPLRRVGERGEGLWRRISWDEAYAELATRIRTAMDAGVPEEVAIHIGRSRIGAEINRFMRAIGSPTQLNHRALCSSAKRAANYVSIGETDWETPDAANTKYILNFGSNFYEAHQGAIHLARRVVQGRFDNGAKLVTFDVRLSNTAGRSDEWFACTPGTEGAIALAMGHVILAAGLQDRDFIDTWINVPAAELAAFYAPYTPDWAAALSGVSADDITRLALEFAAAAPACFAMTNRGTEAHYNGFHSGRAVILLNALVGSVGRRGGFTYTEEPRIPAIFGDVQPQPPAPQRRSVLEDPPEYPLANKWQRMRVGQLVYAYLRDRRARLQVYISYTLGSPTTWPEGRSLTVDVLRDEAAIGFHACSDVVYSETAHYADLLLPDAAYTERWGFDTRNNFALRRYVVLRQPLQAPPAEVRSFADVLIDVAKRLGPDVARYYPFANHEEQMRLRCSRWTAPDGRNGWDFMRQVGVWVDLDQAPFYELFRWELTPSELVGARFDAATRLYHKAGPDGRERVIGIHAEGKPRRGFLTPSRKFQVRAQDVVDAGETVGWPDDGWPRFIPIPSHQDMPADRFHLVSFKWNVHTQARTAPQRYLSEIVHHNPLWMNTATAAALGIRTGDNVEITTFRPRGATYRADGERLGSAIVPVIVTEGIHPRVLAMSNSLGHEYGGRAATARGGVPSEPPGQVAPSADHNDYTSNIWWDKARDGTGAGHNINAILPVQPSPLVGMQAWYDTVCEVRKVG